MLRVCVRVAMSAAHSRKEGSVQVIEEVHAVFFKETGGHEAAPATQMGCAFN